MSQVRQARQTRRPRVDSGPIVRRIPPPLQVWQEVDALLGVEASWPRPVVRGGAITHVFANQKAILPTVAQVNDEPIYSETFPKFVRVTRSFATPSALRPPSINPAAQSDEIAAIAYARPEVWSGRPISPPHVAHPYTLAVVPPEPPPPPDVVVVQMNGPRRLPGTARTLRSLNPRLDDGVTDVPPQVLNVPHQRASARPLQVVHQTPLETLPLDDQPTVSRGVRARPNPTAVTLGQQHLSDFQLAELQPDTVQVRQVRPWVPLPRMPLGQPQEQPLDTDPAPQSLSVPHRRTPALPPMNVRAVTPQELLADPKVWQTPPPPGKKIPPLTPVQVLQYSSELLLLEYNPARLYWTFGVNAVFPAVTARVITLLATDTTTQAFWSFDSTTQALYAVDTTAKSLKS